MARYIRKTVDEFEVQQYTGTQYGWECVCTEETRKEAKERKREYHDNQPEYPVRVVKKRIKREEVTKI